MENFLKSVKSRRVLYEILKPFQQGFLKVSEIHSIYWEVSGNPEGKPAVILHGGPGGGMSASYYGLFDPSAYKIVQIDQRGSGSSTPHACIENNTTWDLVEDIEKVREYLNIEKWHTVLGGSWGSTLSLAYAQTHPSKVGHLVLRGIFLVRPEEIKFFYQEGSSWLYPDYHEELKSLLPEVEQHDILSGYWRRLNGKNDEDRLKFAKAWTKWEMSTCKLIVDDSIVQKGEEDKFALAFARIETHYFVNGGFFTKLNQLLENAYLIKDIPTEIVHGRYDIVCPLKSALDLHKKLENSVLHIIQDAGHSFSEPGIIDALVTATDKFKSDP